MKGLLLVIALSILLFSCGGGSGSTTAPVTPEVAPGKSNILKIKTSVYGKDSEETAEHLVSISVSNSSAGFTTRSLQALTNGIKIPTNTTISIKLQTPTKEDYPNAVLWTGYAFGNATLAKGAEIEILMDRDISLTLMTTDTSDEPLETATLFFSVVAPEALVDVGVKLDNYLYGIGTHEVLFAKGQEVVLRAVRTINEDILFLGFQTVSGINTNINFTNIMDKDITVQLDFIDKSSANKVVTIIGIHPGYGEIFINDIKIDQSEQLSELTNVTLSNRIIGQKITLKAASTKSYKFVSWNDDLLGYLSDTLEYEYVVSGDATITPLFSQANGVITVSVYPRTNYFTTIGGAEIPHEQNKIRYSVKKYIGGNVIESGTGNRLHLSWENNVIYDLAPGDEVTLIAMPGEGFYNKNAPVDASDESKVKWSGAVEGLGYTKVITIGDDATSKGVNVNFTIERREVTVKLETLKQENPTNTGDQDNWIKEDDIKEDAKGYAIDINGVSFKDSKTANRIFDWHTKVDVKIYGGRDYEVTNSIQQTGESGNSEEEKGYNKEPTAGTSTLTFDLEGNTGVFLAKLNHKKVEMSLNIIGGEFGNKIDSKYHGFIKVIGSGYPSIETNLYKSGRYYNGIDEGESTSAPYKHTLFVLSGIPVTVYANRNANVFERHSGAGTLIPNGSTTATNVVLRNVGMDFGITSRFYAPIWTLTVNMRGNIEGSNGKLIVEADEYNVPGYAYTIQPLGSDSSTKITENTKQFFVTNGLPVQINVLADSSKHYTFHSISDVEVGITKREIITTNNTSSVQISFIHVNRKMKMNILGGRDDRNQSYVKVSGTGVLGGDKIYYADSRNTSEDGKTILPAISYNFNVLSGIKNVLKFEAVTSPVHNFDRIYSITGSELTPTDSYKRGPNTYSSTNSSIVNQVAANDDSEVGIDFRINSYNGALNGLDSGGEFAKDNEARPPNDGRGTYNVYSAGHLGWLARYGGDFSAETINLMNDIYIGYNTAFNGFTREFKGKFAGNGFVIFDLAIPGRALLHTINSATVSSLVTARGYIHGRDVDNVGVIGTSINSTIKYVTNVSSIGYYGTTKINTGGVIGSLQQQNNVSFIGNFGSIEGKENVGGVVGRLESAYYDNKFMFNRGTVKGWNHVGGVIGRMDAKNQVYQVYNAGKVEGVNHVGGVIGVMGWSRNGGSGDCKMVNFYNLGTVVGGSGIVGSILGCREIITGTYDKAMTTEALENGYGIGDYDVDKGASIATFGGYTCDGYDNGANHYINIRNVVSFSKTTDIKNPLRAGLPVGSIDSRINGGNISGNFGYAKSSTVTFYRTYTTISGTSFNGEEGDKIKLKLNLVVPKAPSGSPQNINEATAFEDKSIWISQWSATVNEFIERPTFRDMPEQADLPKYMYKYDY